METHWRQAAEPGKVSPIGSETDDYKTLGETTACPLGNCSTEAPTYPTRQALKFKISSKLPGAGKENRQ
jgi:hypothetical protein